ncbi:unnamed protein product [Candida verbasci]|uniref:Ribosome biogenesis protein NSA1 n=1 Tax=Candida verbasci TaxID=1227364 RepID=A0A9W4XD60_9ASCO|nr:unnamed protein product [Candida verbasci]
MKFLVSADDTGAAKEVVCVRGTDTSKQDGIKPKSIINYITEPTIGLDSRIIHLLNYNFQYVITSRLDGNVSIFTIPEEDEEENKYELLKNFKIDIDEEDRPISLQKIEKLDSILVAYESCKMFIIPLIDDKFEIEPIEIKLPKDIKNLHALTINPQFENILAVGGQEQDLKVLKFFDHKLNSTIFKKKDYESKFNVEVLYSAKNVKNDHLDMRVPIWITNILFLEGTQDQFNIITSTRYGQIRIYDTKHGKKPIKDYKICEKPILKMKFANEEKTELILTNTHNLIGKYSLNKIDDHGYKLHSASAGDIYIPTPKLLGKFTGGNTGATFGIQVYEDIIAVGGLDRYLRVFDLESREVLAKVYLGVEISSLLILDEEDIDEESTKRKRQEEDDEEEIWNQLKKNK